MPIKLLLGISPPNDANANCCGLKYKKLILRSYNSTFKESKFKLDEMLNDTLDEVNFALMIVTLKQC